MLDFFFFFHLRVFLFSFLAASSLIVYTCVSVRMCVRHNIYIYTIFDIIFTRVSRTFYTPPPAYSSSHHYDYSKILFHSCIILTLTLLYSSYTLILENHLLSHSLTLLFSSHSLLLHIYPYRAFRFTGGHHGARRKI